MSAVKTSDLVVCDVKIDHYPDNKHNQEKGIVGDVRFRIVSDGTPIRELDLDNDRVICNLKYMSEIHHDDEFGYYVKLDGNATHITDLESIHYI